MENAVTWYRRNKARILFTLLTPLALCSPQWAGAQDFPSKPVTIVIPFGPGGHSDLVTRPLSAVAQKYLGQPLLIEMKPGGQGIIGTAVMPPKACLMDIRCSRPVSAGMLRCLQSRDDPMDRIS